ncbi:hypothetical protein C0J52_08292, partial [Blattella germanica]
MHGIEDIQRHCFRRIIVIFEVINPSSAESTKKSLLPPCLYVMSTRFCHLIDQSPGGSKKFLQVQNVNNQQKGTQTASTSIG